ncbi:MULTISPECIES: Hint domain-containing protein [unclassified Cyanobium]|uniref:Hint domain-containing protein n=1 Tax=unclassified Cyanobium TaxID=2627006 RepID=UPI0020CF24B2|nr:MULTISPECIES: Hint domain-containing protein [unclassified Cyanobium]MCP9835386.1 Hint domain-containing protein [Cyanobium sp. La Preciosa 7G6]MCP9938096.1 Hint domain-containing protein [Cyanobium sp. Aljojuca 7A6]
MTLGVFDFAYFGLGELFSPPLEVTGSAFFLPSPAVVTKVSGGDRNVLLEGDEFTISGDIFQITYTYRGQDPSGGLSAEHFGRLWITLSDIPQDPGQPWPAVDDTSIIICFAAGTLIATPDGERMVETLAIGDLILTTDGREVPVRWMGRQTRQKLFTPERSYAPVRVRAGALAVGVPHTDLILTGDHALIIDDLAINASALVNGTTITFEPMADLADKITYWHIETEGHEEILANGAPTETFVDYVGRRSFDNHQEYLDLYGCERIIPEMTRPRVSSRRQLPAATAARFGIPRFGDDIDADFAALVRALLPV